MPSELPRQSIIARLDRLKLRGIIAGWEAPHPNHGIAGGMLPWVVMPATEGPASLYDTERDLSLALDLLERFGPTEFTRQDLREAA
jgi:hypothetical protein